MFYIRNARYKKALKPPPSAELYKMNSCLTTFQGCQGR